MFALLTIPLAVIMGVGSTSRWKKDKLSRFIFPLGIIFISSIVLSGLITWRLSSDGFDLGKFELFNDFKVGGFAGLALGIWVIQWSIHSILERLKNQDDKLAGIRKIPASIWGMSVAHFGIGIFIIGVAHVNAYSIEKDIRLKPGETYQMAGYKFSFGGVSKVREENYLASEGKFIVTARSGSTFNLEPQKRTYSSGSPMTEAAINTTVSRDIYVSLGDDLKDGSWSVRLYYKSFVACIWIGGFIMALGGLIATCDRRYRRPVKKMTKQQLADVKS